MPNNVRPTAAHVARRLLILRNVYISGYFVPPMEVLDNLMKAKSKDEYQEIVAAIQERFGGLWQWFRESPICDELSPDERTLMDTPVDGINGFQLTNAFWRVESANALMWCLGLIDASPPYDTRADDEPFKLPVFQDYALLIDQARLRPEAEINAARDYAELWHWRSRTRELLERGDVPQSYKSYDDIVRKVAKKMAEEVPPRPTIDEDFLARGIPYRDLTHDDWCDVRSITIERHLALNWVCGYGENNRWDLTPTHT